jgi:hypothetical protein
MTNRTSGAVQRFDEDLGGERRRSKGTKLLRGRAKPKTPAWLDTTTAELVIMGEL